MIRKPGDRPRVSPERARPSGMGRGAGYFPADYRIPGHKQGERMRQVTVFLRVAMEGEIFVGPGDVVGEVKVFGVGIVNVVKGVIQLAPDKAFQIRIVVVMNMQTVR